MGEKLTASYFFDPAFIACLHESVAVPELVANFNRLYGATLGGRATPVEQMVDIATGKAKDDMRAFIEFVHFSIYTRLPEKVLSDLRASALQLQVAL